MSVILAAVKCQYFSVCLDDIVIHSKYSEKQIGNVHNGSILLNIADVSLRLKTFNFITETIKYLDHVIRPKRLEFAEQKTGDIRGVHLPKILTILMFISSLRSVFSHFDTTFAHTTAS